MALRTRLHNYIDSLKEEGVLDSQYDRVKSLQPEDNPCFILDIINHFCNDAHHSTGELANVLSEPVMDYNKVITYVCLLKGSSSSIVGCGMAVACRQLPDASVNWDMGKYQLSKGREISAAIFLEVKYTSVKGHPVLHMPPPFSSVIQESERGSWHVPITGESHGDTEIIWLCITRPCVSIGSEVLSAYKNCFSQ